MITPQYLLDAFGDYLDRIEIISYPAMVWPGFNKSESCFDTVALREDAGSVDYCSALFESVTVLSNGDVVPCCYDIIGKCVLGNIMCENLFNIWDNARFTELRQAVRQSEPIGICKECMLFSHEYLSYRR